MTTQLSLSRSLHRLTNLLLVLAMLLPPSTVLAAPPPAPVAKPAAQSATPGLIVGEVYQDLTGLPIAGATVTLLAADGAPGVEATTDARGRYRLTADPGAARLHIGKAGHTGVERAVTVLADQWVAPLDARLTLIDPARTAVPSVLGGTATNAAGDVSFQVPAGAMNADSEFALTALSSQALAGMPPRGWSPVAAAEIQPGGLTFNAVTGGFKPLLSLPLPADLPASATAVAARWDATGGRWIAIEQATLTPAQTRIEIPVERTGQIALFVPDPAPNSPGTPATGQPLTGVAAPSAVISLTATLLPTQRVIFTAPGERAQITVKAAAAAPMTSGEPVAVTVDEAFQFSDATNLQPQPTVQDFLLFAFPGEPAAPAAAFVVAPSYVAEPHALRLGTIDLAVRPAAARSGVLVRTAAAVLPGPDGAELALPRRAAPADGLAVQSTALGAPSSPTCCPPTRPSSPASPSIFTAAAWVCPERSPSPRPRRCRPALRRWPCAWPQSRMAAAWNWLALPAWPKGGCALPVWWKKAATPLCTPPRRWALSAAWWRAAARPCRARLSPPRASRWSPSAAPTGATLSAHRPVASR